MGCVWTLVSGLCVLNRDLWRVRIHSAIIVITSPSRSSSRNPSPARLYTTNKGLKQLVQTVNVLMTEKPGHGERVCFRGRGGSKEKMAHPCHRLGGWEGCRQDWVGILTTLLCMDLAMSITSLRQCLGRSKGPSATGEMGEGQEKEQLVREWEPKVDRCKLQIRGLRKGWFIEANSVNY